MTSEFETFFDSDAEAFFIVDAEGRTAIGDSPEEAIANYKAMAAEDAIPVWELPRA